MEKVKNFLKWAFSPSMILTFLSVYVVGVKLPQGIKAMYTDCRDGVKTVYNQSVDNIGNTTFNSFKNSKIGALLGLNNKLLPLHDGDFVVFKPVPLNSIAKTNGGKIWGAGSNQEDVLKIKKNYIDLSRFNNPGDGINVKIENKQCIIMKNKLGSIELLVQDDKGEYKNKGVIWQACGSGVDNDILSTNIPGFKNEVDDEQATGNNDRQNSPECRFLSIAPSQYNVPFAIQEPQGNRLKGGIESVKPQDVNPQEDDSNSNAAAQSKQAVITPQSVFFNDPVGKSAIKPDKGDKNIYNLYGILPVADKVDEKNEFYLSHRRHDISKLEPGTKVLFMINKDRYSLSRGTRENKIYLINEETQQSLGEIWNAETGCNRELIQKMHIN